MSSESSSSASTSDKTSTSAPKTPGSEAEYLAQQAEDARKAMQEAMKELASALARGADPRALAQQWPWMTVGAAAAAGFLAAYGLVPSQEQAALKRIEAVEEAIARGYRRAAEEDAPPGSEKAKKQKSTGAWLLRSIARQSFNLLKPTLMAAVTAQMKQSRQPDGDNGRRQQAPSQP